MVAKGYDATRHECTSASKLGFPTKQSLKARFPKELEFAAESELPLRSSYLRHQTLRHRRSSTAFEAAIEDALDGMRRVQPNTNSEPTR